MGIAIGPLCASIFFYIGGYTLPFYVCGILMLSTIPFIYNLQLPEDEEGEVPQFMTALFDFVKNIILILCYQLDYPFDFLHSFYGYFHQNLLLSYIYKSPCREIRVKHRRLFNILRD